MFHEPVGRIDTEQMEVIRKNMITVFRSLSRSPLALEGVKKAMGLGAGLEEMPFRRTVAEDSRSENVVFPSTPSMMHPTNNIGYNDRLKVDRVCCFITCSTIGILLYSWLCIEELLIALI